MFEPAARQAQGQQSLWELTGAWFCVSTQQAAGGDPARTSCCQGTTLTFDLSAGDQLMGLKLVSRSEEQQLDIYQRWSEMFLRTLENKKNVQRRCC